MMVTCIKGWLIFLSFALLISFSALFVCAEKLDIEVKDSYVPGEEVKFKVVLYDDSNNKIEGDIDYMLQDYYTETIIGGSADSGQEIIYKLPTNAYQGPWKIIANYKDIAVNRLFNVNDLEKAEIKLEGDILAIKNIGNTPYDKKILIYIGDEDQTAQVSLEVGQEKKIRLTAPTGQYDIKVIEGDQENVLEFKGIGLTGNVVGLESVLQQGSFLEKNKIVVLFLGTLLLVIMIISVLKIKNKGININTVNKNINKNKNKRK
jgi:hypothetical protein